MFRKWGKYEDNSPTQKLPSVIIHEIFFKLFSITTLPTFSLDISYCLHKSYWAVSLKILASLISHSSMVKSTFRSLLFSLFCNIPFSLLRQVSLHRLNLQDLALMFSLFKTLHRHFSSQLPPQSENNFLICYILWVTINISIK